MPAPRPTAFLLRTACLLALAGWAAPAAAQVVRCTDPATGHVTYTNGSCARGEAGKEIERARTPEELAQERAQAAQAQEARRERLQREAEQQRIDAANAAPASAAPRAPDPAQSAACRHARQALQEVLDSLGRGLYDEPQRLDAAQRQANLACLTPAEQARAARAAPAVPLAAPPAIVLPPRPHPRPPKREISYCNVFRCYDKQGNSYPVP